MLALLLTLISAICSAGEVGFGVAASANRYSLTIGDMNYYQQTKDQWDLVRYGNGYGKLNIGNGIGLDMRAYGGASIFHLTDEVIAPQLGLDFANLIGRLDSNSGPNFYAWLPGVSVGPQINLGFAKLLIVGTAGAYAGNINRNDILPDFRFSYGAALHLNSREFSFSVNAKQFNGVELYDVDTYFRFSDNLRIGVQAEKLQDSIRGGFLIKSELF